MKIKWNKIAKHQWQGTYNGHDLSIKPIGDDGYLYEIWNKKGKLISSGIKDKFWQAKRNIKRIVKSNFELF